MLHKVGFSIGGLQRKYDLYTALDIAKEVGADAVDVDLWFQDYRNPESLYSRSDEEIYDFCSKVRKKARQLGLEISQTHGRLRGFATNAEENAAVLENARRDCIATAALGAPASVMHGVSLGAVGPDLPLEQMRKINLEMFSSILPYAKQQGVQVAMETLGHISKYNCCNYLGNIHEFLYSYDQICEASPYADAFAACVDTGHSNSAVQYGHPTPADVIRMLGSRVTVLHLNDNDGHKDQHKLPLGGTIDWNDVLAALKEIGYEGVYNLELNLTHFGNGLEAEYARFAVAVMRNLLK